MTRRRQALGNTGENLAVAELERRGYAILDRRYRTRHGEIDVVARDGGTLVFVEVKARTGGAYGTAADAVTRRKQLRLVAMATDYLARHGLLDHACRFDVVAIDEAGGAPVVTVFQGAFEAA